MSQKTTENIGQNASQYVVGLLGAERVAKATEQVRARAQLLRNAAQACQAAGLPWKPTDVLADDLEEAGEVLGDWLRTAESDFAPAAPAPQAEPVKAPAAPAKAPSVRPADLVRVPELPTPAPKAPEVLQLRKAAPAAPTTPAPQPEPSTGKFTPGERAIWIKDNTQQAPQAPQAPAPQGADDEEARRLRKLEARRARRAARKAQVG